MVKRLLTLLKLCACLLMAVAVQGLYAKDGFKVSGKVTDAATGLPLAGATIVLVGNNSVGVVADGKGMFSINLPALTAGKSAELTISYMGYLAQTIKVPKATTSLWIQLKEEQNLLESVVVQVGYGQQTKASTVAAIVQTSGADLVKNTSGITGMTEALQGMLPGVITINSNSMPGAEDQAKVFIRGKASWNDAVPLVLVDGVERDMNNVDMNEVSNVSVLKDASATAVFGVRGANGVILITTKKGDRKKPVVSLSANFGLKQFTSNIKAADPITTMEMYNESARNDGLWDNMISESVIEAWRNNIHQAGPYNQYFPLVDMWKELTKKVGFSHNYNVNVSGGTEVMRYFISLGYMHDGDVFKTQKQPKFDPSFKYDRYNWRSNFDFSLTKSTELSAKLSGSIGYQSMPGFKVDDSNNTDWMESDVYGHIYRSPTFEFPIRYEDGTWGDNSAGNGNMIPIFSQAGQRISKAPETFADVELKQDLSSLLPGLSAKGKVSYTYKSRTTSQISGEGQQNTGPNGLAIIRESRQYDLTSPIVNEDGSVDYPLLSSTRLPDAISTEPAVMGTYDNFRSARQEFYYELSLNYSRSFARHNVSALALFNRNNYEYTNNNGAKMEFPFHYESWVGRLTYNWAGRYLAEVNAAYNGSEKFAPGRRFGFFPSFSLGWRISEEPFIRNSALGKFIDNLKVRYSYGQVGSDKGAVRFNYIQTYNTAAGVIFGSTTNIKTPDLFVAGPAADEKSTWETATKQNFGIEATLIKNLSINLDFFVEEREGILMKFDTPLWVGQSSAYGNIGKTKNRGFELEVSWNGKIGRDWGYWLKGNVTMNQNRVVYRNDPKNRAEYRKMAGKPIGYQQGYVTNGYYTSLDDIYNAPMPSLGTQPEFLIPGDLLYIDYNGDGIVNTMDKVPFEFTDYPMNTGGLQLGISYKGFELSAMFYGVWNQRKMVDGSFWDFEKGYLKALPNVTQRWTPENAAAGRVEKPALHATYGAHSQTSGSDLLWVDADYLRLKNAEISYSLPVSFIKKAGLSKAQVYISGNNLFTITGLDKNLDPESAKTNVYPIVRRYNMGLRVTF